MSQSLETVTLATNLGSVLASEECGLSFNQAIEAFIEKRYPRRTWISVAAEHDDNRLQGSAAANVAIGTDSALRTNPARC